MLIKRTVSSSQRSLTITELSPGTYTFNVSAEYSEGRGSRGSVSVVLEGGTSEGIVEQPWFYAAVASAGVLLIVVLAMLVCCICCQLHRRKYKGQTLLLRARWPLKYPKGLLSK